MPYLFSPTTDATTEKPALRTGRRRWKKIKDADEFYKIACKTWLDVRTFGQVFAFKDFGCSSVGVRGPVSIHLAKSADPVDIQSMQITKSVSGDKRRPGTREAIQWA